MTLNNFIRKVDIAFINIDSKLDDLKDLLEKDEISDTESFSKFVYWTLEDLHIEINDFEIHTRALRDKLENG